MWQTNLVPFIDTSFKHDLTQVSNNNKIGKWNAEVGALIHLNKQYYYYYYYYGSVDVKNNNSNRHWRKLHTLDFKRLGSSKNSMLSLFEWKCVCCISCNAYSYNISILGYKNKLSTPDRRFGQTEGCNTLI